MILRDIPVGQLGQRKVKASNIYKTDQSFQQFLRTKEEINNLRVTTHNNNPWEEENYSFKWKASKITMEL